MRTTLTASDVKLRFPEFSEAPEARVTFMIEEAYRWVDDGWGDDRNRAVTFLVGHWLILEGATGATVSAATASQGPVQSESLGDASVTYASPAQAAQGLGPVLSDLKRTTYGQRFLELLARQRGGARVTNAGT